MSEKYEIHKSPPPTPAMGGRGGNRGEGQYEWLRQAVINSEPYQWYHVKFNPNGDTAVAKKLAEAHRSAISSGSNAWSMTKFREDGWTTQTAKRIRDERNPHIPSGECWLYWRKIRAK